LISGLLSVKVSACETVARAMNAKELRTVFIQDSGRVDEGDKKRLMLVGMVDLNPVFIALTEKMSIPA
jgi:hypothetical protein